MKRTGYCRMGALGMGIFLSVMLLSLAFYSALASTEYDCNNDCTGSDLEFSNDPGSTRARNDVWYIYTLKEIIDNRTFDRPIIVNNSGELRIKNSAIFEINQNHNFHRNITVKDNGTLRLRKGTLNSNKPLLVTLEDNGKLILENASILKARQIVANDNSMIQATSSMIVPGIGGLVITINDEAELNLIGSSIENADLVSARDQSSLQLTNSEVHSTKFDISCKEITITSNKVFRDLKVDRVEYAYFLGSAIDNIDVISCGFMRISSGSKITNCRLHDIKELNIQGSTLDNIDIKEVDSTLSIKNSKNVTNVFVNNCTTLELIDSHIKNFKLEHFSYNIDIVNSEIEQSSILPKNIKIHSSTFRCNRAQLDTLSRAEMFVAYNSTFNDFLKFSGTSVVSLINCSTSIDIKPDSNNPPKVQVYDDASVNIYWWLDVLVIDAQDNPLPGATISILDFIYDNKVTTEISDYSGKIKFKLLGNTITKHGWKSTENNSYYMVGKYGKQTAENRGGIFMEENMVGTINFFDVNKKEKRSEPELLLGTDTLIGILILFVVLILIWLSVAGLARRNNSENSKNHRNQAFSDKPGYPYHGQRNYPNKRRGRKIRRTSQDRKESTFDDDYM